MWELFWSMLLRSNLLLTVFSGPDVLSDRKVMSSMLAPTTPDRFTTLSPKYLLKVARTSPNFCSVYWFTRP